MTLRDNVDNAVREMNRSRKATPRIESRVQAADLAFQKASQAYKMYLDATYPRERAK